MKSNQMTVIVAVALLVAAWADARGERKQITVVEGGNAPAQRMFDPPALPPTPPPPVADWSEPQPPDAPVAETEPITDEVDGGLAPYPAWNGYDLDCPDVGHPVRVDGPDPHRLDGDGDGIGCEGQ